MIHTRISAAILFAFLLFSGTPSFANGEPTSFNCDCPSVTSVSVTSTVTSVTVSWTSSSIYSSYIVQILKGNGTKVYFQATTTGNSVVINGTSPSTTYRALVIGICGDSQTQASPSVSNFTTVAGIPNCGAGATDIGGNADHPANLINNGNGGGAASDQIDFEGDIDYYIFTVVCPGVVTVGLSSLSNDYDLSVSAGPLNGGGFGFISTNSGTTPEKITFTTPENLGFPFDLLISVNGFGTAYNTYDCYALSVTGPLPCFSGGGGGENLQTGNGKGGNPIFRDGNLQLSFDTEFQKDEQVDVQVFSADGRMVWSENTEAFKGETQITLDLPGIINGIYLVKTSGSFGEKTQKFVVTQ